MNAKITKHDLMDQSGRTPPASQATAIEQTRAVAQVQGALVVAHQRPRDTMAAAQRMREACQTSRLAEKAFFSYSRGGSTISGASIHLATELARCWGNMDYGIVELARDDERGISEMQSYAWDLETNLRSSNTFIVPHKRDKTGGSTKLTEQRDIYENNANNAARRLRECIFRAMPKAFTEEAQELCRGTIEHGGGKPIAEQREKLVEAFGALGISARRIAKRIGRQIDKLTPFDLGELRIAYRSVTTGEASAAELFPDDSGEAATDAAKAAATKKPDPIEDVIDGSQGWATHDSITGEIGTAARATQGAKESRQAEEGQKDIGLDDRASTAPGAGATGKSANDVALILPGAKRPDYYEAPVATALILREADGRGVAWLDAVMKANTWMAGKPLEQSLLVMRKALVDGGHG